MYFCKHCRQILTDTYNIKFRNHIDEKIFLICLVKKVRYAYTFCSTECISLYEDNRKN